MARVREGDQAVLMIVDVQVGVMSQLWESPRIIENLREAVEKARNAGIPVIWVQHEAEHLPAGSDPWKIVPELVPGDGEAIIAKEYNSAFEETPLESELEKVAATRIVLGGAASNWCIRATAYGALARGYDLTLLADAHTTHSMEAQTGEPIPAAHIIEELNTVMEWLRYPGVTSGVSRTEDLSFD